MRLLAILSACLLLASCGQLYKRNREQVKSLSDQELIDTYDRIMHNYRGKLVEPTRLALEDEMNARGLFPEAEGESIEYQPATAAPGPAPNVAW